MHSMIACPSCKTKLSVDLAAAAGRKLLCPSCKAKFTAEEATAQSIAAATPPPPGDPASPSSEPKPASRSPAKPPPLPDMEIPTFSGEPPGEGTSPSTAGGFPGPVATQGGVNEDDGEDYRPRRRRRRDEDDEENDDRPRSRRRRDIDEDEDEDYRSVRRRREDDDGGLSAIIPYKNGYALAAYYFGMFGLIACLCGLSVIPGLVAVILGFRGLSYAKANPQARGRVHAWVGIILGILEILVSIATIALILIGVMSETKVR